MTERVFRTVILRASRRSNQRVSCKLQCNLCPKLLSLRVNSIRSNDHDYAKCSRRVFSQHLLGRLRWSYVLNWFASDCFVLDALSLTRCRERYLNEGSEDDKLLLCFSLLFIEHRHDTIHRCKNVFYVFYSFHVFNVF